MKGWGTTDCQFFPQVEDGVGLPGTTKAPFPGDAIQGELFHHLPDSLLPPHSPALPLCPASSVAPTPLAAGKCLPGVKIPVQLSAK